MKTTNSKNFLPLKAFTMADPLRGGTHFRWLRRKAVAFTMAEILLSLAVIGIIAAMTLPTLTANFQDRAFNAKRQALHARLANAFRSMDYSDYLPMVWDNSNGNADKFINDLTKAMSIKVINESDRDMLFNNHGGHGYDWQDVIGDSTPVHFAGNPKVYFQTVNGESIGLLLGSPTQSDRDNISESLCFLLVYDLNGPKGPNELGKDYGVMGAFYYDHMELYAPMLGAVTSNIENDDYQPDEPSSQRYKYPDYRLPSKEELEILTVGILHSNYRLVDYLNGSDTVYCAIDGHKYKENNLIYAGEGQYSDDAGSCLYPLITNDGSAPKNGVNGVAIDINESWSEDPSQAQ